MRQSVGVCLVECGEVQGILTNKNVCERESSANFLMFCFPMEYEVSLGMDLICLGVWWWICPSLYLGSRVM